jgi:hypothetical protein
VSVDCIAHSHHDDDDTVAAESTVRPSSPLLGSYVRRVIF